MSPTANKNIWLLIPTFGTILFVLLYIVATLFYPGGSQFDKNAVGFSWIHNYWCNLLNDKAINGRNNPAQPIAITAMLVLCGALTFFWLRFPAYTNLRTAYQRSIQIFGTTAMLASLLLLSSFNHDGVTNTASLFGCIALLICLAGLYKNRWRSLFFFGLLNIVLVVVNNILYYNEDLMVYLPLVQKITFATMLFWISCMNVKMYDTQVKIPVQPIVK